LGKCGQGADRMGWGDPEQESLVQVGGTGRGSPFGM